MPEPDREEEYWNRASGRRGSGGQVLLWILVGLALIALRFLFGPFAALQ
jgi:hypothetical protein